VASSDPDRTFRPLHESFCLCCTPLLCCSPYFKHHSALRFWPKWLFLPSLPNTRCYPINLSLLNPTCLVSDETFSARSLVQIIILVSSTLASGLGRSRAVSSAQITDGERCIKCLAPTSSKVGPRCLTDGSFLQCWLHCTLLLHLLGGMYYHDRIVAATHVDKRLLQLVLKAIEVLIRSDC